MRTVTKIYNVYQFNELSDKAKDKARDWYRQHGTDHEWWDGIYDQFKDDMKKNHNIEVDEIRFSGFSSQGDGASFTTSDKNLTCDDGDNYKIVFSDSRYCHDNTMSIEYTEHDISDKEEKDAKDFLELCKTKARELYANLESSYDYLNGNESVDENIKINEYEFLDSGEVE